MGGVWLPGTEEARQTEGPAGTAVTWKSPLRTLYHVLLRGQKQHEQELTVGSVPTEAAGSLRRQHGRLSCPPATLVAPHCSQGAHGMEGVWNGFLRAVPVSLLFWDGHTRACSPCAGADAVLRRSAACAGERSRCPAVCEVLCRQPPQLLPPPRS